MKHGLWLALFLVTVVAVYFVSSSKKKPADDPKAADPSAVTDGSVEMPSSASPSGGPLSGEITPAPPMTPPAGSTPPPQDPHGMPPQVAPVPQFGDPTQTSQVPYEPLPPPAQGQYEYDDIPPPTSQGYVEPANPGEDFVDAPPPEEDYR